VEDTKDGKHPKEKFCEVVTVIATTDESIEEKRQKVENMEKLVGVQLHFIECSHHEIEENIGKRREEQDLEWKKLSAGAGGFKEIPKRASHVDRYTSLLQADSVDLVEPALRPNRGEASKTELADLH
jgi:hypothetical protein